MSRREFQLIEGTSKEFWTIELAGVAHTVHFGQIGTAGQTSRKEFATEAEARSSHDKLVAEKLKNGYLEAAGTASAPAPPPAPPGRSPPSGSRNLQRRPPPQPGWWPSRSLTRYPR